MICKIGDAFSLIRNGANIKQGADDTGYPITRIETISNRVVDRNKMGYAGIHNLTRYADFVLQDGDILMSHINSEAHLGKVAIYEKQPGETIIHGMNLLCLRPKREIINSRYAYYFLSSDSFLRQIPRITKKSVNQASFNVAALKSLDILIAPMGKQQEIVNVLDKINEITALCEEQLATLDELVKARFVEMFGEPSTNVMGWVRTTVGDECFYIKDGPHKSLPDIGVENGGHPFISVRNIVNHVIDFSTAKYISDKDYADAIKKCHPQKGDMLYSKGGTTGIAKLVDIDIEFANWVHVAVLKFPKDKLNGVFFEYMLNSDYCYDQSQRLTKGIANKDLVLSAMAQIKMYRPPIELQTQFAAFVQATDQIKSTVQTSLDELETLKKSLMQEFF